MTASPGQVRHGGPDDAEACAAIYAPYVTETVITFELDPPPATVMAGRIAAAQRNHAWLVLEDAGRVVGYAYAGVFKERAAYRWACEVSVYLEQGRRRGGGGRALYTALFEELVRRGYRVAIAVMTLPNEASLGLHHAMGFTDAGILAGVGWKNGAWHDVAWAGLQLTDLPDPPAEPV